MEVRQRRERGCRVFLSCENQIFLKLPQQWLAEKAATAMTGQGHNVCTHNLIHHRAPDTISINLSSACTPPKKKKQYFYSITSDWTRPATHWPMGRTAEIHLVQKSLGINTRRKQNTHSLAYVCVHTIAKRKYSEIQAFPFAAPWDAHIENTSSARNE